MTSFLRFGGAGAGVLVLLSWSCVNASQGHAATLSAPVTVPFQSVRRLIVVDGRIGSSAPLAFIVDTGATPGIVDIDRARALGLHLRGNITVSGTGSAPSTGAFVDGATATIDGLPTTSAALTIAMPLDRISHRVGRRIDGILGGDFLREFVAKVDYDAALLTFFDRSAFQYQGSGETLPLTFDGQGHPVVMGSMALPGRSPMPLRLFLDLGATGAVTLHAPFVTAHQLPLDEATTTRAMGAEGAGGRSTGRLARATTLSLGRATFENVPVVLSTDEGGVFAATDSDAHVGAQVMRRFTVFLDYAGRRLILEPGTRAHDTFDPPSAGVMISADGDDFRRFQVIDLDADGAAAQAGVRIGDIILSLDDAPASTLTLDDIVRRLERAQACRLVLQRADARLTLTVTPRIRWVRRADL